MTTLFNHIPFLRHCNYDCHFSRRQIIIGVSVLAGCLLLLVIFAILHTVVFATTLHPSRSAASPTSTALPTSAALPTSTPATVPASSHSYRLSGDVLPTHYILEMITDLENFNFQGKVWIKLDCKKPTDTIRLHSHNLNIHEKEATFKHVVNEKDFKDLEISSMVHNEENQFLIVKLKEQLIPDKNYILFLPFDGILSEGLAGYYRSSYIDRATNTTKWLAVTQFESTDARRAFPCFDEPDKKAKFTIKMAHKAHLKSISNMPIARTIPFEGRDGWVWDEYMDSVPMSTYLVAFMVSEFEFKTSDPEPNKVLFRVWARPDAIDQVDFARKVGPKFLSYFEQYFDVSYPLPKQDMVAIPDFNAGAMENWGMITYREIALLYDENMSSKAYQSSISSTIAHELAHQWFGNLVTMKWWTDLWLNEGFATYVSGLGVNHLFPEWNFLDGVAVENLLQVYTLDSLESSHPVSVTIGHPSEITQIFDHISYKKGSFLLRMMNLFLGEEVFRHGVSAYLKNHRYGNAEQDNLWASLTEQAHKTEALPDSMTVKEIMDSWTLKTGYPVVSVTRDYDSGTAKITQKRFLSVKGKSSEGCWWVPITYSSSKHLNFNNTRPHQWLSCDYPHLKLDTHADKKDWLILNNKFAGLYRVNYDEANWALITKALQSPQFTQIDVLNRAQLLADSLDLAFVDEITYPQALALFGYLSQETHYLPWRAGLLSFNKVDKLLRRSPVHGHIRRFMQKLLKPVYDKMGRMTEVPSTFEGVKHQSLILNWACRYDVGDCDKQAMGLFNKWMSAPETNPIPKDLRKVVYCQGVKEGGQEAWEFMWNQYRSSNLGTEQNTILNALSCTPEPWLLNRFLERSIEEGAGIRRQDTTAVFSAVAKTDIGYYVASKYFARNIQKIHDYIKPKTDRLGRFINVLAEQMTTQEELDELRNMTETHKALLERARFSVRQSLETVTSHITWLTDNYQTIANTLAIAL